MIIAYLKKNNLQARIITHHNKEDLLDALWIDLLFPNLEEEGLVEAVLGLDVPTREEMQEIELSNRLYKYNGDIFLTATMLAKSESPAPKNDAVTIIITDNKLITVRYVEPQSFDLFISRLSKIHPDNYNAMYLVIEFLDAATDRLADILERIGHQVDDFSQNLFRPDLNSSHRDTNTSDPYQKLDYQYLLKKIGANGDLNSKAQESLVSFDRLVIFLEQTTLTTLNGELISRITTLAKDIHSMTNHSSFLANKVIFLLDATLGLVNIEQNNVIKIFSIVAVILLPPTLVASIYGMNFQIIPELSWKYGYPIAIVLMIISGWIPYKYFKKKGWL